MAGVSQPAVERLREFLRELPPGARALLIAELERSMLRGEDLAGEDLAGGDLVLLELRRIVRASQCKAPRVGNPVRLFFNPLEPFLVDDGPNHKHPGRIARAALQPIWQWLGNSMAPGVASDFAAQVEAALAAGDNGEADLLARAFQDRAHEHIRASLAAAEADDRLWRRIGVQLGTDRAHTDLKTLAGVLKARDDLDLLGRQLPGHIKTLTGTLLESVKAQLDARRSADPDSFLSALVLVMSRLAAPWQLVLLATRAAHSDAAARIEETPYAVAVQIVLTELTRMVGELSADLKSGRGVAVAALLRDVHDSVRGLRTALDLATDSAWARQLTAIRADISRLLSGEINLMPGRVRRLLRPLPAWEIASGSVVDADDVAEAESLVGFVLACRNYASELAVNEITQRAFTELQQCLDAGTKALLDALRGCGEDERAFRQSQVDAAVRFCAKVFGQDYATLLTKAADVASHNERKAARG